MRKGQMAARRDLDLDLDVVVAAHDARNVVDDAGCVAWLEMERNLSLPVVARRAGRCFCVAHTELVYDGGGVPEHDVKLVVRRPAA
jgi:hypothetical protein